MVISRSTTAPVSFTHCSKGAVIIIKGNKILFRNRKSILIIKTITIIIVNFAEVIIHICSITEINKTQGEPDRFICIYWSKICRIFNISKPKSPKISKLPWKFICNSEWEGITNRVFIYLPITIIISSSSMFTNRSCHNCINNIILAVGSTQCGSFQGIICRQKFVKIIISIKSYCS